MSIKASSLAKRITRCTDRLVQSSVCLAQMRLYTALIALLVTAVMTLIVTWTRYHRDVSEALATADTQRPRMPLKPSGSKSSKKKQ